VPGDLKLGSGSPVNLGWAGRIQSFALLNRALSAKEVEFRYEAQQEHSAAAPSPPLRVRAALAARSHVPSPQEIAPYRESLAVFEYRVLEVLEGESSNERIRVAHWLLLDGTPLPYRDLEIDSEVTLQLSPFSANRQLKNANLSDTLEPDFDLDLFLDEGLSTAFEIGSPRQP
jgi:hypothetical protein